MRKLAISFKWCSIKKFFSEKAFSKGQMILFAIILLYGITIFPIPKFVYFVIGTTLGWVFGVMGIRKVKEYLQEVGMIIYDPDIGEKRKLREITAAYHRLSYLFGVFWETQDPALNNWKNKKNIEPKEDG